MTIPARVLLALYAIGDWLGATPTRAIVFLSVVMTSVVVFG